MPAKQSIIDLKPKEKTTHLSFYELLDAWGVSGSGWTPIMLRLRGLFVDEPVGDTNWQEFSIPDSKRPEPIYEFLYVNGGVKNGNISGKFTAPPSSPTNGALLWPPTLTYFANCIRETTPGII